jgi:hypothetical protein
MGGRRGDREVEDRREKGRQRLEDGREKGRQRSRRWKGEGEIEDKGSERIGEQTICKVFLANKKIKKIQVLFFLFTSIGKQICAGKSAHPELRVLDEPYSAKAAQRSSHTPGPPGYIE